MHLHRMSLAALLLVGLTGTAQAQDGSVRAGSAQVAPSGTAARDVNVDRLPLDVGRVERQLRAFAIREERDGLNLRYTVDVFGRAPRIQLFTPQDNLAFGPAPWGAPTHNDILNVITPREFRSPVMDFNALIRWLSEKGSRDSQSR